MFADAVVMDASDPRMVALRRYVAEAFGERAEVKVYALRTDQWAWVQGDDDEGHGVSLDVKLHRGEGATAALAAALQSLAHQRKARAGAP